MIWVFLFSLTLFLIVWRICPDGDYWDFNKPHNPLDGPPQ